MKRPPFLAIAVGALVIPSLPRAEEDTMVIRAWIAQQVVGSGPAPFDLATAQEKMKSAYAGLAARPRGADGRLAGLRANKIAFILGKDLDNDGNVTSEELKRILTPQASKPLRADSGLQFEPTKEQAAKVLQELLTDQLEADLDKNRTISFDEMREFANPSLKEAFSLGVEFDLHEQIIVRALDTSGDKKVSETEFLSVVKDAFSSLDRNGDGTVAPQEAMPYQIRRYDTF